MSAVLAARELLRFRLRLSKILAADSSRIPTAELKAEGMCARI